MGRAGNEIRHESLEEHNTDSGGTISPGNTSFLLFLSICLSFKWKQKINLLMNLMKTQIGRLVYKGRQGSFQCSTALLIRKEKREINRKQRTCSEIKMNTVRKGNNEKNKEMNSE